MGAIPAGYEDKVKCEGRYANEPPAAPKGWQYVKQVLGSARVHSELE